MKVVWVHTEFLNEAPFATKTHWFVESWA